MSYTALVIILNVLFVLVVAAGFFVGFWRGLKKSALSTAFAIVGAIVAFFSTPSLTNLILGIKVAGGVTLNEYILNLVTSDATVNSWLTNVPSLGALAKGLPAALLNMIVFILLTVVIEVLLYVIYKILSAIFFRNKVKDGEKPAKKHRVWGGVIGAVKTLALTVFVMMPLSAAFSIVGNVTDIALDATAQTSESEEGSNLFSFAPWLPDAVNAYNNSGFSVLGRVFGLNNAVFDYYTTVKVDDVDVKLGSEINTFANAYDAFQQFGDVGNENFKFADINFDQLEDAVNRVLNSGLYKTVAKDFIYEIVYNYENYDFIPQGVLTDILQEMQQNLEEDVKLDEYLKHDIELILSSFKTISQNKFLDNSIEEIRAYANESDESLKKDKLIELLGTFTNDENFESTKSTLVNLFSTHIVHDSVQAFADLVANAILEDVTLTPNIAEQEWKETAEGLAEIFKTASTLLSKVDLNEMKSISALDLLEKDYDLDNILPDLGKLLDLLDNNKLFAKEDGSIVQDIVGEQFALPETYYLANGEGYAIDSYQKLFAEVFLPSLNNLKGEFYQKIKGDEINVPQLLNFLADKIEESRLQEKDFLLDTILPLVQVKPTDTELVNMLDKLDDISFSDLSGFKDWQRDLTQLSDLLVVLKNVSIEEQNGIDFIFGQSPDFEQFIISLEGENLKTVLAPLLKAKCTQSMATEIFTSIEKAMNELINDESVTVQITSSPSLYVELTEDGQKNKDDQTDEVCAVFEQFIPILKKYKSAQQSGQSLTLQKLLTEEGGQDMIQNLLDAMKTNAQRKAGVFKDAYTKINQYIEKLKSQIPGIGG